MKKLFLIGLLLVPYSISADEIKVSKGKVTPPFSEVLVLSRNAMITSVNCWEHGSEEKVKRTDSSLDMYYKMPTFLLED